jgi:hypothetical protein
MKYNPYLLLFAFIFICSEVKAQVKVMKGLVLDSITHFPIANATVTNGTRKKSVQSNENGVFRLEVAPNDFIYAYAKSYSYDTLNYSFIFSDTVTLYLSPTGTILPNVTVTTRYNKYQLDSIERKTAFDKNRGTTLKTLSTSHPSGFGLTFNLDKLFKDKYKNQKRQEHVYGFMEEMAYVDYRFSPHLVAYYTGLKGDELKDFLHRYTPDYKWFREHPSNEDVMYYINDKLKEYKALKHQ